MRLFLLAARHRMQALSALACCVGCAFSGFASLKTALFIQLLTNEGAPLFIATLVCVSNLGYYSIGTLPQRGVCRC